MPTESTSNATQWPPLVRVGPFDVMDIGSDPLVDLMADCAGLSEPKIFFALHVGGLSLRNNAPYVAAMAAADGVYADGMATVLLARAAGAQAIERSGTTDIAHGVLDLVAELKGAPVRVSLIGGQPGLAERAGTQLSADHDIEVVQVDHGYHDEWEDVLWELRACEPDVVFVGLGMPKEAEWVVENRAELPPAVIITCGGFFGHVVGDEKRAPGWAQKSGLEWVWRAAQQPQRLIPRYAKGLGSTAVMLPDAYRNRRCGD